MKVISSILKKPQRTLAIALVLCVLGSFLAGMANTSFYNVDVSKITFKADHGTLSGLLYMPKGAEAEDPRPVIITTHGYLNSREMQDAPAIEMSRRGYIVLALDMYDHGDSKWADKIEVGKQFSTFWIYSQIDAAKYIYGQNYVKKDSAGNAYIAVSGHSMGGFSSLIALYMDEMNALTAGHRMIYAGISVGADYSYAAAVATQEQYEAAFGSRTVGMIAAHFDEFFFNKAEDEKTDEEKAVIGTVQYKDFVERPSGKEFLGLKGTAVGEAGKFYTAESGPVIVDNKVIRASELGKRVIYTPYETHPWNHFSVGTTANLIDFYTIAFKGVTSPNQKNVDLAPGNQIWWLKEGFSFVALIGFFMLFVPLISLLIKLPLLKRARVEVPAFVGEAKTTAQKAVFWVSIVLGSLLPAYFYPALVNKTAADLSPLVLVSNVILISAAVVILTFWCVFLRTPKEQRAEARTGAIKATVGALVIAAFTAALKVLLHYANDIIKLGKVFNEPITNQIAYWAVVCGVIAAIILICFYYLFKKPDGTKFENYGISFNIPAILCSLIVAVIAVAAGYGLLWGTQALFTTDYRLWTFAVKTFRIEHLLTALRYMPIFFVYYFINSVVINANTRTPGLKGAKGYLIAIWLNVGGLLLWIAHQYLSVLITGVGAYPSQSLMGIVLFALVPCLAIAAVYAKRIFNKTGNVWLAAFLNAILFTMIAVANTVMFWNFV